LTLLLIFKKWAKEWEGVGGMKFKYFHPRLNLTTQFFEKLGCDFSFPDGKIVKQKAILLI